MTTEIAVNDFGKCAVQKNGLPEEPLRQFNPKPNSVSKRDSLGLHTLRILNLHPELVKYRLDRMSEMDSNARRDIFYELNEAIKKRSAE